MDVRPSAKSHAAKDCVGDMKGDEKSKSKETAIDLGSEQARRMAMDAVAAVAAIPYLLRQIEAGKLKELHSLRTNRGLMCEYDVRLWHLRNVWKDVSNRAKRVPAPTSNIDLTMMRNAKHQQLQHILQTQCEVNELRATNCSLRPLLRGLRDELAASIGSYQCLQQQLQPQYAQTANATEPTLQEVLDRNCALREKVRILRQQAEGATHCV